MFDVLAYVAYALPTITRAGRADHARVHINSQFNAKQQAFLNFVLSHYVTVGVEELDQSKLTPLLRLKYTTPSPTPWPTWASRTKSARYSPVSSGICMRAGG